MAKLKQGIKDHFLHVVENKSVKRQTKALRQIPLAMFGCTRH